MVGIVRINKILGLKRKAENGNRMGGGGIRIWLIWNKIKGIGLDNIQIEHFINKAISLSYIF